MPNALKRGPVRFYFPDFPDHPYNGCTFSGCSMYTGWHKGKRTRTSICTFEDTTFNRTNPSGYWEGPIYITKADFNADKVLVTEWNAAVGDGKHPVTEQFYLT